MFSELDIEKMRNSLTLIHIGIKRAAETVKQNTQRCKIHCNKVDKFGPKQTGDTVPF